MTPALLLAVTLLLPGCALVYTTQHHAPSADGGTVHMSPNISYWHRGVPGNRLHLRTDEVGLQIHCVNEERVEYLTSPPLLPIPVLPHGLLVGWFPDRGPSNVEIQVLVHARVDGVTFDHARCVLFTSSGTSFAPAEATSVRMEKGWRRLFELSYPVPVEPAESFEVRLEGVDLHGEPVEIPSIHFRRVEGWIVAYWPLGPS